MASDNPQHTDDGASTDTNNETGICYFDSRPHVDCEEHCITWHDKDGEVDAGGESYSVPGHCSRCGRDFELVYVQPRVWDPDETEYISSL